jgi:Mrp family chromosome partitioning ATPase
MSKNFELLQDAAKERLSRPAGLSVPLREVELSPALAKGSVGDEISNLVQRLFFRGGKPEGPRVVSFSGVAHDDRSSWICARVGESLAAQANASICLVDADFCCPRLHTHLAATNSPGLGSALTTEGSIENFAIPVSRNLWLMSSGLIKVDLNTHIEPCRTRFAELRRVFDYVLISAAPFTRESDSTLTGQLSDGVVIIVEANSSRRETVRRVKERLELAQVRLLGAVLDQRTFPIPESLYRKL